MTSGSNREITLSVWAVTSLFLTRLKLEVEVMLVDSTCTQALVAIKP